MLHAPPAIKSAKVSEIVAPMKSRVTPQIEDNFDSNLELHEPSEFIAIDAVK
jgi:hypothetical protein